MGRGRGSGGEARVGRGGGSSHSAQTSRSSVHDRMTNSTPRSPSSPNPPRPQRITQPNSSAKSSQPSNTQQASPIPDKKGAELTDRSGGLVASQKAPMASGEIQQIRAHPQPGDVKGKGKAASGLAAEVCGSTSVAAAPSIKTGSGDCCAVGAMNPPPTEGPPPEPWPEMDDELLALKAIFEDDFVFERVAGDGSVIGSLSVTISLGAEDKVFLRLSNHINAEKLPAVPTPPPTPSATPSSDSAAQSLLLPVQHVPPVIIRFRLPPGYPRTSGPVLSIECPWLCPSRIAKLRRHVAAMWKDGAADGMEGEVVMYQIGDFVKEESVGFLDLCEKDPESGHPVLSLVPSSSTKAAPSPADAEWIQRLAETMDLILEHDRCRDRELFELSLVQCGICFDEKKGALCVRFVGCGHAFCRECLSDYFSLVIKEGDVKQVTCPDGSCKKKAATADSAATKSTASLTDSTVSATQLEDQDLLAIVGQELFARYQDLRLKQALEGRVDVTYCPRPICQSHVIKEAGEEKLCVCKKCGYAFCFFCGRTWHGYAQYCKISRITEVAKEYEKAEGELKRNLEIRYGKRVLERAVRDLQDQRLNEEWMQSNAQKCPTTKATGPETMGSKNLRKRKHLLKSKMYLKRKTTGCFLASGGEAAGSSRYGEDV
ncbi:E3 ubiquitin-protein ligase rnf14 [Phlyctochytrium bullatum]|nr:E3 ubiquitin-protein ligase rnf14 [Phlyctochytrium bullatum]